LPICWAQQSNESIANEVKSVFYPGWIACGARLDLARFVFAAALFVGSSAYGQTAPGAGSVFQTVPPATVRPESGPVIEDKVSRPRAIADVEGLRLDVKGFRITGLTVASPDDFAEDLATFLGKDRRFQDLLDAAAAIKRRLAGMGFFLADVVVPEQKINGGIVELQVLEGRLGKVRLEVDPAARIDRDLLLSYISGLQEGGQIEASEVERALFQIHDLRGIVATSSFAPGLDSPAPPI
jgi:hemolysin activation/secretion protein